MSDEQEEQEFDGTDQSESEFAYSPSEGQAVDPTPSISLLTVENVKKLEEAYPTSKSALARWSIETFMKQNSHFLNKSGSSTDRGNDQKLSDEKEAEAAEVLSPKENTSEGYPGKSDISSKEFQTSSLTSSVPESIKKHEVADLETQTEWSYSSSSLDSAEKAKRKLHHEEVEGKETSEEEEKEEIPSGSVEEEEEEEEEVEEVEEVGEGEEMASESETEEAFLSTTEEEAETEELSEMEDHSITDLCQLGCCEFCTSLLKPLPSPEELEEQPEKVESFICCRTYKEIFHCVIEELMEQDSSESEIDINPHRHLSQAVLESETKKLLKQKIEERGFKNYREILKQYIKFGPCTKISFRLKNHPPKLPEVVKKKRPRPEELLKIDLEFKAEHLKMCHSTKTVKRYYPDGKIFYLLFPDGTGQVYYPSGNIAILITYVQAVQFTYIVLSDSPQRGLQAFFTNQGYAAVYYHRNGNLRLNLDLCSGSYLDRKKIQRKHWNWWDTSAHIHAPPFQPISIQLNVYIQVKVESQDRIFLTFTKVHDCLQLNVGARLKLKDESMLKFLTLSEDEEELLSRSRILRLRSNFANFHRLVKKLCFTPSEHTPELYLFILDLCDYLQKRYRMKNLA